MEKSTASTKSENAAPSLMTHERWIEAARVVVTGLIALPLLLFAPGHAHAQFTFVNDQSIPVSDENGNLLTLPWAGGINAAQFNTIDLNQDGKDDLVLFDRTANKLMTFLNKNNAYEYAPAYESYFPAGVTNWILLKDYNCDGKKDIFTGDLLGMKVYRNLSTEGGAFRWEQFLFYVPGGDSKSNVLMTLGFTQKINLQLQFDDLPAIIDADHDGDLDIFNVRYTGNGTVEYHQNFSVERYNSCDSLDFERQTTAWGGFTQCRCEHFEFNGKDCSTTGGRTQHAGGKALLALDLDNDSDHELIYSEAECSNLFVLENEGDLNVPVITKADVFPSLPVDINIFPAAFHEDVDFDGVKDLVATPNIYRKEFLDQDLKASTWFYKNIGTNELPEFSFIKNSFLQDQMIDVGDNAIPAFQDEDGDGDLDLFIGFNSDASSYGSIFFYRNIGSPTLPHFQLVTDNFADIKSLKLYNIKPQFADINSDGRPDLLFLATDVVARKTAIYYFLNTMNGGLQIDLQDRRTIDLAITSAENYHFTDINRDGRLDVLVGRFSGALEYWQNVGSPASPNFYLENSAYLNIGGSVERQSLACVAIDLNDDQKEELVLSNQMGIIGIVNDFRSATSISAEQTDILFNSLTNAHQSTFMGRAWPTAANLFGSKRPAIVAGTVRGGLEVFRNEGKEPEFDELALHIYPNPAHLHDVLKIESNLPLTLQVYSILGQQITSSFELSAGLHALHMPNLSKGVYIFKLSSGTQSDYRRIVISD